MSNIRYVAISNINKTGDIVDGAGGATYDATFASYSLCFSDATFGERNLVLADEKQILHQFNNVNEKINVSAAWVTSLATDNYLVITCAPGLSHKGKWGDGVRVIANSGYTEAITIASGVDVLISSIEIENTNLNGRGILVSSKTRCAKNITNTYKTDVLFSGSGGVVESCFGFGKNVSGGYGAEFTNYDTANLYNSVFYGYLVGVYSNTTGINGNIKNVASFENGTDFDINDIDIVQSNNASSDGTANGTGSLINQVATDCFVDPANGDFRLKSGSNLIGSGFDLSGIVDKDITDSDYNTPYPIGCFAFESATGISNIFIGENAINKRFVGANEVDKVYIGDNLVYSNS